MNNATTTTLNDTTFDRPAATRTATSFSLLASLLLFGTILATPVQSEPLADGCRDRLLVEVIGPRVVGEGYQCLTEADVEQASAYATQAFWRYDADAGSACTILQWWTQDGLQWVAAPCHSDQEALDPLPGDCRLNLSESASRDLCAMSAAQAQFNYAALRKKAALSRLALQKDYEVDPKRIELCPDGSGNGNVQASGKDHARSALTACPQPHDTLGETVEDIEQALRTYCKEDFCLDALPCPGLVQQNPTRVCGVPVPNPCPAPVQQNPTRVCGVPVPNPCPAPVQQNPTRVCSVPVPNPIPTAPCGTAGKPSCQDYVCTFASNDCDPPPTDPCHYYDNAPGTCGNPWPPTDPCAYQSIPGLCSPLPQCPSGSTGAPPACVSLDCPTGTTLYDGGYGLWCATPLEISRDSFPSEPAGQLNVDGETAEDEAEEALHTDLQELAHPAPLGAPGEAAMSSETTVAAGPNCAIEACTVVFIRGYTPSGAETASYNGWWEIRNFYLLGGYNSYQTVDYYGGACGATATATNKNSHDGWMGHGHDAGGWGEGCEPGSRVVHSRNTDARHLAYHLAWWLYDTYGPTEKIDIVAHSLGGLLIRYAMAEMALKNPEFPPLLNIEDVVTLGSPHRGTKWGCHRNYNLENQMCPGSSFLTWLKANGANPQGATATDWTVMGAVEDDTVSKSSATGMQAMHKVQYPNYSGGYANTAYDHNGYYNDESAAGDGTADWQEGGGTWYRWNHAFHSLRWAYYASTDSGW